MHFKYADIHRNKMFLVRYIMDTSPFHGTQQYMHIQVLNAHLADFEDPK